MNKQTEKTRNAIKKHNNSNNNKYTDLRTVISNLLFLGYFTQKIPSSYRSDDIYK